MIHLAAEPVPAGHKLQGRVIPVNVLVTGGAGYIGSHFVRALLGAGHGVVVVDDLSAGHRDAVPAGVPIVQCDVRAQAEVRRALREHRVEAVVHFASRIQVGESVRDPRLYYRDNLAAGIELLEAVLDEDVGIFVLSSTAAVYGDPRRLPLDEDHSTFPVSPYGATKLALEGALATYSAAYGLRYAALRYFNACGADGGLSERHDPETHLIPLVLDAAMGARFALTLFGADYATPDGTCVRDYVHVADLAVAHLAALDYLSRGGESGAFNLGTGHGYSVREVIEAAERVTGRKVPVVAGERRAGDPPELVAAPGKALRALGWVAMRSGIDEIVRDAFRARFPEACR
jgi:UDP-glucose 4-epimerase